MMRGLNLKGLGRSNCGLFQDILSEFTWRGWGIQWQTSVWI